MQETEDIVTRLEIGCSFVAEMRQDGSIAIAHKDGGLHMASLPEATMVATIATLRAEAQGLRADAGRYRWLRDHGNPSNDPINPQRGLTLAVDGAVKLHMVFWCTREQLDAAIDAAKADK